MSGASFVILALLVGAGIWALSGNLGSMAASTAADMGGQDMSNPVTGSSSSGITSDPSTWPGDEGDPIWKCCHAIGFAEGANRSGSNPDRLNNPGDISDGASRFGSEFHSGSHVTSFPDKETGWQWLRDKVANIVNGKSSVYSPDLSWTGIAQKWAGDWQNWVGNVTSYLGVSPLDRFGDFFGV